jgi:hypothetical protein
MSSLTVGEIVLPLHSNHTNIIVFKGSVESYEYNSAKIDVVLLLLYSLFPDSEPGRLKFVLFCLVRGTPFSGESFFYSRFSNFQLFRSGKDFMRKGGLSRWQDISILDVEDKNQAAQRLSGAKSP